MYTQSDIGFRYVPGYLQELRDGHVEELDLFKRQLSEVRLKAVHYHFLLVGYHSLFVLQERGGQIPDSFGKYLLEKQKELGLSDNETAYLAGSMFGAGSDTTASAISIAVLAAACYPKAQAKVQEELDAIVGRERGGYTFEWFDHVGTEGVDPKLLRLRIKKSFLKRWLSSSKLTDGDQSVQEVR